MPVLEKYNLDQVQELTENYDFPVLLLNRELRIAYKNSHCNPRFVPLRLGSGIKKHLSPSDYKKVAHMKVGASIKIDLDLPIIYGAYVYRGSDFHLIGLRTLTATLQKRVEEVTHMSTNLTESTMFFMNSATEYGTDNELKSKMKTKSNRLLRAQNHIGEFLRIINGIKSNRTKPIAVERTMSEIIDSIKDALRPLGIQLYYTNKVGQSPAFIDAAETDFSLIICLLVHNAIKFNNGSKIRVEINDAGGNIYITYLTDTDLDMQMMERLCRGDYEKESFTSPDGWTFFELLLIRLLCEFYLWDFGVVSPGAGSSSLQFTLKIPSKKIDSGEVSLSQPDKKDIDSFVLLEMSELFDTE